MKQTKLKTLIMLCFMCAGTLLYSQNGVIQLRNPSFEDNPRHSQTPREWNNCGFDGESEPDIQPNGEFGVNKPAKHGKTYLGMVVRDNATWERAGQQLINPMKGGTCYSFTVYMAKSSAYTSRSRISDKVVSYNKDSKLRIYGGFSNCERKELLAESPLISNHDWAQFRFRIQPKANYTHIVFEVFYHTPNLFPYNGNILLDNASSLIPVDCEAVETLQRN